MKKRRTDIPEYIYQDEVIQFLANRYHTTPQELLHCYQEQNYVANKKAVGTIRLEENELAILHDLIITSQK